MYMSIRRDRLHKCGHSNIDYRTKNDQEAVKTFMPWLIKKDLGTMGYESYKLPYTQSKRILKVTESLNTQRNILHEIPDPKYYSSALFYRNNNIAFREKAMFACDRVAQLDEAFKGKAKFTGDSMLIADLNRNRKLVREYGDKVKEKELGNLNDEKDSEHQLMQNKAESKREQIINDKREKNKSSNHETQIQKIEVEETCEHQVDIKKLIEIRLALRRRYIPRTNYRKIFKEWDKANLGEITIFDAHNMINRLSIPINLDETRALISSSNKRETETLDMEEFMHLIFNDNDELNLKVKKISKKEDRFHSEGEKLEYFKKSMVNKITESTKKDHEKYLLEYLRVVIPKLAKNFDLNSEDKLTCDYVTFKSVLANFKIPQKYIEDNIISEIFKRFISKSDTKGNDTENKLNNKSNQNSMKNHIEVTGGSKMNFRKFIDYLIESQETNDFFDYKKKIISNLDQKLGALSNKIQSKTDNLTEHCTGTIKNNLLESIINDISQKKNFNKKNNYLEDKITTKSSYLSSTFNTKINSAQPSLGLTYSIFKDRDIYFTRKSQIENDLSPNPAFFMREKAKTRFNGNPPHKNTFYLITQDKLASSYVDEKKRFDIRGKWDIDFQVEEKARKTDIRNKVIERKKKVNERLKEKIQERENYEEMKDNLTQLIRTHKVYKYEMKNKVKSEMIE